MSQSMTTVDYVAMIVVIVPCLFLMCLLPLLVDLRQERRLRQHTAAPVVEDRHLFQADGKDHPAPVPLVPAGQRGGPVPAGAAPSPSAPASRMPAPAR
jgi:hypothetical protein